MPLETNLNLQGRSMEPSLVPILVLSNFAMYIINHFIIGDKRYLVDLLQHYRDKVDALILTSRIITREHVQTD